MIVKVIKYKNRIDSEKTKSSHVSWIRIIKKIDI